MQPVRDSIEFARFFGVSRETGDRLQVYSELLKTWQRAINLVSPTTLDKAWHRHFADSAQLITHVTAKRPLNWVDFGSGAGFPGLVIAVLLSETPGSRVTLVESDAKKCAFLREVVRKTELAGLVTVDILCDRIETAANSDTFPNADIISARALAPLSQLLTYSAPIFGASTVGLFLKGRDAVREICEASKSWTFKSNLIPSVTDPGASLVIVKELLARSDGQA